MREIGYEEYLGFISSNKEIVVEDQAIPLEPIKISRLSPKPEELTDISTTVWSFPKRGSWATHRGNYRGNWAPQIPRALIEMYTKPGEIVLDAMCGSGTSCIEARLLGRNCICVDINYSSAILSLHRLYWLEQYAKQHAESGEAGNVLTTWSRVYHGDARRLDLIQDSSIDLVATHPPYWGIIRYGDSKKGDGDLSKTGSLGEYLDLIGEVARELYRVLKPGRYCAILIGDTRVNKHYVPISYHVLQIFLKAGFILKEEVVKIQHRMKTTREVWRRLRERDFLLIYHEKLFIFRKPEDEKDKYSGLLNI